MGRDGGWPGIELSTGGGRGCRRDHLYCNCASNLSLFFAPRRTRCALTFSAVSSFVFHLSAFTCTYSYDPSSLLYPPPPLLALFAFHVRLRRRSRFMRSLSIFHDSMFYCLYESFYPAFLLAKDISLRSVTFYA